MTPATEKKRGRKSNAVVASVFVSEEPAASPSAAVTPTTHKRGRGRSSTKKDQSVEAVAEEPAEGIQEVNSGVITTSQKRGRGRSSAKKDQNVEAVVEKPAERIQEVNSAALTPTQKRVRGRSSAKKDQNVEAVFEKPAEIVQEVNPVVAATSQKRGRGRSSAKKDQIVEAVVEKPAEGIEEANSSVVAVPDQEQPQPPAKRRTRGKKSDAVEHGSGTKRTPTSSPVYLAINPLAVSKRAAKTGEADTSKDSDDEVIDLDNRK